MYPQRVIVGADFGTVADVTVNSERYRAMLNEFLFPKIEENDMDDIWFQEDEAI